MPAPADKIPDTCVRLRQDYIDIRAQSVARAAPLSDEDCTAQSMPDASPVKWHLAHTTWFFETFILEAHESGFKPFQQSYRYLFNSYYNGIGAQQPRHERGLITRPTRAQVQAYREQVDTRILKRLHDQVPDALATLLTLGLQHEQQHQELILTDTLHLLSRNPLHPSYDPAFCRQAETAPPVWYHLNPGLIEIGHQGEHFCFDNESPSHKHFLAPYELADRLVTNAEYAAFIAAGGYDEPSYWLSEGWSWKQAHKISHPLYWQQNEQGWHEFSLAGLRPLHEAAPVMHVSYYEAAAFAHFSGARLPTEAEWECAAKSASLRQMFGAAWQWTSSSYAPYPGYQAAPGAIGEYNGKFMVNQYVLRGSSLATPLNHSRPSYRNFFPAHARWQFSGIRLAR